MRGVYTPSASSLMAAMGSSPHARGLPVAIGLEIYYRGIIPACAGFTGVLRCGGWLSRDHPRMRGVYRLGFRIRIQTEGSSPHARGLPSGFASEHTIDRIIPACAGFTRSGDNSLHCRKDHPRMRGVYLMAFDAKHKACRIIPACAGFTFARRLAELDVTDHPRMRGVYSSPAVVVPKKAGSSPHARGLRRRLPGPDGGAGIIPACAGFTCRLTSPRGSVAGSSPHARGLRPGRRRHGPGHRIIPACAGFTPGPPGR